MTEWLSRLIQPRGLKSSDFVINTDASSRGLYSLVDWNIIEKQKGKRNKRRGLYSLVDWNHHYPSSCVWPSWVEAYTASWIEIAKPIIVMKEFCVEAYTASWIEIAIGVLKYSKSHRRGLYSLVDWNNLLFAPFRNRRSSRLIQPRGLKYCIISRCIWMLMSRLIQPRGLK